MIVISAITRIIRSTQGEWSYLKAPYSSKYYYCMRMSLYQLPQVPSRFLPQLNFTQWDCHINQCTNKSWPFRKRINWTFLRILISPILLAPCCNKSSSLSAVVNWSLDIIYVIVANNKEKETEEESHRQKLQAINHILCVHLLFYPSTWCLVRNCNFIPSSPGAK